MIELPESENLSQQIAGAFLNKEVVSVEAAHSPHGFAFYSHPAQEYPRLLIGSELVSCVPAGGQLDLCFGPHHLVFNDGVNVRYLAADAIPPEKHQFCLRFADETGFYCTVSMYAGFMLYENGVTDNHYYVVGKEKPSPLSPAFDPGYFDSFLSDAGKKMSLKAFLATEQRIPGLGNGVLQDILFNARMHPQKKLEGLSREEIGDLFTSVKETLIEMAAQGGRNTEKDLFGNPGGYRTILSNKTKDDPCPRCGEGIVKKSYLGGSVYYCPSCQGL